MSKKDINAVLLATTPPHSIRPWALSTGNSPRIDRLRFDGDQISFLLEMERNGTPLIEPGKEPGTELFTFVWHGDAPHGVVLRAAGVTDPLDPEDTLLEHIPGTTIHALTLEMPDTWQVGYLFAPLTAPLPATTLHRPVDLSALSALMSRIQQDPFAREAIQTRLRDSQGTIIHRAVARGSRATGSALWHNEPTEAATYEPILGPASGTPLSIHRWSHPSATDDAPVVTLLDGDLWLDQLPIIPELEIRIRQGAVPPLHAMFLGSTGPRSRSLDLSTSREDMELILSGIRERLLPLAGPIVLVGQSLGGLFALHAAGRFPDLVSAAIAQSPSLWWPNVAPTSERPPDWFSEQSSAGGSPAIVHVGALEWVLRDRVRDAAALLRVQGRLIHSVEFMGGHDTVAWQALLPDAIERAIKYLRFSEKPSHAPPISAEA